MNPGWTTSKTSEQLDWLSLTDLTAGPRRRLQRLASTDILAVFRVKDSASDSTAVLSLYWCAREGINLLGRCREKSKNADTLRLDQ